MVWLSSGEVGALISFSNLDSVPAGYGGREETTVFIYIYDDRRYLADCEWDLAECG